ncbi:carbohydrate ABC transporter permease [Proteiniclasticum ruminis]|uniref:carbohydrate ABC transporter permease n=1 Tax=Proteiniclasticum ruminis TaxID=398199 RepID=UPI0028A5CE50|nr:carbohydrate ABC transporter permease [Proteiniclasticum ruminis]
MKKKKINLYKLFIYSALIALAVSIIVPVLWVFMASVKDNQEFYGNPWSLPKAIRWENFKEAVEIANMGEYFTNSIVVTALAIGILLLVSIPCAYALARFEFKGRKILSGIFQAGIFINVNYIVVPIFLMLLDWDIALRGRFDRGFFLDNRFVLALVYAATAIPFTVYLLSNYFRTIPKEFEEAASVDGASHFKAMVSIMIPMAKPSIITVILFNFLAFWNEYIIALTLMPSSTKTLPVGLINLMQSQRGAANYGPMYAGLVLVMLPTLILYVLVQKKLTEGMTVGGVKG